MPSTTPYTLLHQRSAHQRDLTDANVRLLVVTLKYLFGEDYSVQAGWLDLHPSRLSRVASGGARLSAEQSAVIDLRAIALGFDVLDSCEHADGSLMDDLALLIDAAGSELANQIGGGSIASSAPNLKRVKAGARGWSAEFARAVRGPQARQSHPTRWPSSGAVIPSTP